MAAPRLLYVVTEDWYFLSHRLPMARAAQQAGYEVHVATRLKDGAASIAKEGFVPHALDWSRGSLSPLGSLSIAPSCLRLPLICPSFPCRAQSHLFGCLRA